jgi:exosortase
MGLKSYWRFAINEFGKGKGERIKGEAPARDRMARLASFRNLGFILVAFLIGAIFYTPFEKLFFLSLHNELYSHMILIPFVSGYFIYLQRKTLFSEVTHSFSAGATLMAAGIILYIIGSNDGVGLNPNDYLSLMIFSAVTLWIGGFILFYGVKAFRNGLFPLLFLLLLVPIPGLLVNGVISILQQASTEVAYGFFRLTGVPVYREGFTFHLPGMSIEVAKQCSGIRSSLALFITSIMAGHLFLKTGWKKFVFMLCIFPITVFKNGLRIVTLTLLGTYVDPRILSSQLHKKGGIPFFVVALLLLAPVLWFLRKSENSKANIF